MAESSSTKRQRVDGLSKDAISSFQQEYEDTVDMSIIDALEKENGAAEAPVDAKKMKRLVLSFEKKLKENLELRLKYNQQPDKFMDSELELHEEIQKLGVLSGSPDLYPELIRVNAVSSLASLLSHENTDIAIAVVNLIHDLTDEDDVGDDEDSVTALVQSLIDSNALELLVQNLSRLDESDPDEASGVFHSLSIIENMAELVPPVSELVCERTKILRWLLSRIIKREFESVKLYSSEVMAILVQGSTLNQVRVGQLNGVDTLLQAVAMYKSRDPKSMEEEEMLENLFNCLCSVVMPVENKEKFVQSEGVELMIIIIKQKRIALCAAVKTLDFALTRCPAACERFVDVLGLKTLFCLFLGKMKVKRKSKGEAQKLQEEMEERIISILSSLFGGLGRGSRRDRLLCKFTENEFEKIDRLMEFYLRYSDRVVEEERRQLANRRGMAEADAEDKYLLKLEAGLFTLEQLALVLGHIWSADLPGTRDRIDLLLKQQRMSRDDIKGVLQEYHDNIGDVDGEDERNKRRGRIMKILSLL